MKHSISICVIFFCCLFIAKAQPAKRIMLEEFTGTWCGGCPEGTLRGETIYSLFPQECIQLAWHRLDSLTIPENYNFQLRFGVNSYPTALFNRNRIQNYPYNPFQTLWLSNYFDQESIPAIASVSFSNMTRNGSSYSADVNVEFYSLPESGIPIKINILLIEDSIPATGILEQTNYSSNVENGNDPLLYWKHNSVVRKAVGGTWGIGGAIPSMISLGTIYTQTMNFVTQPSWNTSFMHAVAYVAYDQDTTENHSQILNSEIIHLDNFISTEISQASNSSLLSVFPNPIDFGQSLSISYELQHSSEIEIAIYNANGALVSQPHKSYETAGRHTFLWSTDRLMPFLAKGNYFVEINSQSGESFVQKFVIE
ncbi:MAG: Omp28-related outer membrane protein [Bacteroidetes bacterium]|nr:Omp28-related outer membrane protein [Bacteroidota bacterium]